MSPFQAFGIHKDLQLYIWMLLVVVRAAEDIVLEAELHVAEAIHVPGKCPGLSRGSDLQRRQQR